MTRRPSPRGGEARRPELRARLGRDLSRYARRERDATTFWRSLAIIGSVGWPIVMTMVGGALGGRWLDAQWNTGIRLTLIMLVGGALLGMAIAWNLVRPGRS